MDGRVLKVLNLPVKVRFSILAIMFLAVGCQPDTKVRTSPAEGIPANAIVVGDDLYMVPVGSDDNGCQMYRTFSLNNAVVAAMFFRTADGKFVIDKNKSNCK